MLRYGGLMVCMLAVACSGKSVPPDSDAGGDRIGGGRSSSGAGGDTGRSSGGDGGDGGRSVGATGGRSVGATGGRSVGATGGRSVGATGGGGRSSGGAGGGGRSSGGADGGSADGSGGRSSGGADGRAPSPAQAAVTLQVGVAPGKICSHTTPQLSAPENVAGVIEALTCDLSTGCKPDEYVVVDRDRGAVVTCTVTPNGNTFNVSLMLSVDGTATGSESISFGLNGVLSPTGGTVAVNEQNSEARGGGTDSACQVVITPPHGLVKRGAIWGTVECDDFRDQGDISETGCALSGTFLFENCGG